MLRLLLPVLLAVGPLSVLAEGPNAPIDKTWAEKLKKQLFTEYDKTIRPCETDQATTVSFGFTLLKFDLCDKSSTFTVNGWAKLTWEDKKMRWNENDFNLKVLHVPYDELWTPDVVLYNSVDNNIHQHGATYSLVYNNGTVLWVPPTKYDARCKLNLRLWPFDRQVCKVVVGSWTQHVDQVNLQPDANWNEKEHMTENDEWMLLKLEKERHSRKYECCEEEYADITYTFTLQRRPDTYKTLVLTPAIVVIILTLATFLLPTQCGEKILMNMATAIIICICLYAISGNLPAIAFTPPLIVLFFGSSLMMVAFGFVESVLVIKMSRGCGAHPLPPFIKQALNGWVGSVILNGRQNAPKKDEEQAASNSPQGEFQRDWKLFASALDRIFFVVYALIFLIKVISFYAIFF